MTNLDSVLKSRDVTLLTKVRIVKVIVFPVVTYGCESWTVKKAKCQRIDAFELEKTPESPLDSKDIKPVNLNEKKKNPEYSWIVAEAEAPVFWSPDMNSWFTGKVPDAGKDWKQKEKRVLEDKMAGWHHWCNGHELGQTSEDGEGQGGLVCHSPWGRKESDMTGWLINNSNMIRVSCNYVLFLSTPITLFHSSKWNRDLWTKVKVKWKC